MRHPAPSRRIALAFPHTLVFAERLVQGILDYARERGGWSFTRVPERLDSSIAWLRHWHGDGAFVMVATAADARIARSLRIPVVNLVGYVRDRRIPTVTLDHRAVGRMAAVHLLERRFRRLAYYGTSDLWYSRERLAGFREAARDAAVPAAALLVPSGIDARRRWSDQQAGLVRWLRTQTPPLGVAASTDLRACMVLDACARLGWKVPGHVAVIGVDDDPTVAPFGIPPLSSVARNDRLLGRRAAELLDRLMTSPARTVAPAILVPPEGVAARRSTDTLAVDDPEVAVMVAHVRDHIAEPFGVERLLALSRLSRRRLELRFRRAAGCSPYMLINRLRVEQARRLLAAPGRRTLTSVARACGFGSLRRFRLVFRRLAGVSPAAYRREARADTDATP